MDEKRSVVIGQGVHYQPTGPEALAKRLDSLDKPGKHLWVMTACWAITDPQALSTSGAQSARFLDQENMVAFSGPGCLKCEQQWSRKLAARPCLGSATEPMP